MIKFTKDMQFIVSFLFIVLLLSMFTTQKFVYMFLVLVFFSMIILNSGKVDKMIGGLRYDK